MTVGVDADLRIREYPGDDSATARPVPFYFLDAGDLKVTRVNVDGSETVLVRGTDYSVAGAGNPAGGSVTPLAPIATGTTWRIEGDMTLAQPTDYTAGDDFPAESHERGLDRSMIAHQEVRRDLNDFGSRSLRVPRGETAPDLPSAAARAGTYAAYDAVGRPIGASGTGNDTAFRTDLAQDDGAENIGIKRSFANARRQTAGEILAEQILTPEAFRQPGDTVLQRLQRFVDALGDGVYGRLDADYTVPSQIVVGYRSRFKLYGNGYTIRIADGAATGYGGSALYFVGCSDFEVIDLVADGNRDNRTPANDAGHVIIVDKCHNWRFTRVQANNGTCDGFLIYAGSEGNGSGIGGAVTLDDCPSHWVMDECVALGCWRQGLSVIEGRYAKISGGRYGLTSGAWDTEDGPCAGIDLEPDDYPGRPENRIDFVDIDNVLFDQNQGPGLLITNINGVRNIRVRDCIFDRNKKAAIESFGEIVDIVRPKISGWDQVDYTANVSAPAKRGAIDIGTGAGRTRIIDPEFSQVDNDVGNVNPCIYVHGGAEDGVEISGIRSDGSASDILIGNAAKMNVHDCTVDLTGATAHPHFTLAGANSTFQRNKLIGINERAIYAGGARVRILDNEFYVRIATEVAWCVQAGDSALAEVRGNRIELDVGGSTYGFQVPVDSMLIDNYAYNITTGNAFGLGGAAIFNRGNHFSGVKLTETALAT